MKLRQVTMVTFCNQGYILLLCLLNKGTHGNQSRGSVTYSDIISAYWDWRLEISPEFATAVGSRLHGNRLESFTPEAFSHKQRRCMELLDMALGVAVGTITWSQYRELRVLGYELKTVCDGYNWSGVSTLNPINLLEGIHTDYTYWIDATQFDTEQDFRDYISRLRTLASQIHEQIRLLQEAVRKSWTNHRLSMDSVAESLEVLVRSVAVTTPFYRPFNDSLPYAQLAVSRQSRLKEQGRSVIQDHLLPAYSKLHDYLVTAYLPQCRPDISISSLPRGNDFYQACLHWYLSYDVAPIDLHNMGQIVVSRLMRKIDGMKDKLGFHGHVKDFMKYVNSAERFFYQSGQAILDKYRKMVYEEVLPKLWQYFSNYQVPFIQVQPMTFDGPLGIMMPGSEDNDMPSVFFININDPYSKPKWKMKTLTLHEVIPGRYFQVVYERNQSFPEFRRWREYRKMYSVPFQFPFYNAYTEGWALYAEFLGREMNLLHHPYDAFGQLYSELYRACELVVDTGVHAIGWDRDQAIEYLTARTGTPYEEAADAVTRIITLPGQASAPLYGYVKIKELRHRAQWAIGERFSIKTFHDLVLTLGPVPLRLLEEEVDNWVARQRSSAARATAEHLCLGLVWFIYCLVR